MYDTGTLRAAGDWLESVAVTHPARTTADAIGVDPDGSLVRALLEDARAVAAAEARTLVVTAELARRSERWEWDPTPRGRRDDSLGPYVLAAAEVGPALRVSPRSAMNRVDLAVQVAEDLPLTLAALAAGRIDMVRLRVIADAVFGLGHALAARVEAVVLVKAGDQTPGELRAATARAVITADPDAAEKRRQAAITSRSVSQYVRADGTGVLGTHLSAADSIAMYDLINETAQRLTGPDDTRTADARRADAHVWLLLGRDPHLGPTDPDDDGDDPPPPPAGPPEPYDDTPDPDVTPEPDSNRPDPDDTVEPDSDGPEAGPGPRPDADGDAPDVDDPVEANAGTGRDAEARADAGTGRDAETSADAGTGGMDSIETGSDGDAETGADARADGNDPTAADAAAGADAGIDGDAEVGADDVPAEDLTAGPDGGRTDDAGPKGAPAVEPYEVDGRFPPEPADLDERFPPERDYVGELIARCLTLARSHRPGTPRWVHLNPGDGPAGPRTSSSAPAEGPFAYLEGYGPITLQAGRDLIDIGYARRPPDIPTTLFRVTWSGVLRHDPPARMDREVRARDGTCRFPTCRARARKADLDHTIRFPEGLTLHGNLAGLCRRHHRIKHRGGWTVEPAAHGILHWTSPTGQTYTTYPRGLDHTGPGTATGHLDAHGRPVTRPTPRRTGSPRTTSTTSPTQTRTTTERTTGRTTIRTAGTATATAVPWSTMPGPSTTPPDPAPPDAAPRRAALRRLTTT